MLVLLLFSFLAGIVTILSPCVLPVLPPLLAAGYEDGHRRAWGIITGFIGCFTIATLTLSQALHAIGSSGSWLQMLAAIVLGIFGLIMIIPSLGVYFEKITTPIAQLGSRISPRTSEGFLGGLLLGIALGLLWTPCAGPILATIIILSTLNAVTWSTFFMTAAYAIGAAIPMLGIMYGGSKLKGTLLTKPALSNTLRIIFGILTIFTAIALSTGLFENFQQKVLEFIPALEIENNRIVKKRLENLIQTNTGKSYQLRLDEMGTEKAGELPLLGKTPDFPKGDTWFNSQPLTMEGLKGKVVLVDFWTYSCINCLRTLPYIKRWDSQYRNKGLVIIGVHTPEFAFEKDPENVKKAITRHGIEYPVVLDNDYAIWQSYGNLYWPAHYLIDKNGELRYFHFGEGKYLETENAIRQLLGLKPMTGILEQENHKKTTPETYLGYKRAGAYPFDMEIQKDKKHRYAVEELPQADQVTLEGDWTIFPERIESASPRSFIDLNFIGSKVYLVLSGSSAEPIQVFLDGKPLPKRYYTSDMNAKGDIFIKEPRKYDIISLGEKYGRYRLKLHIPEGISAYAFTFGEE